MKTKVYLGIAVRLIILFGLGMLMSSVTPQLRYFFGDTICTHKKTCAEFGMDIDYHWGVRHYWFFWLMTMLFLLSLLNTIVAIFNLVTKEYPHLKP